jgi:hypothetical protein
LDGLTPTDKQQFFQKKPEEGERLSWTTIRSNLIERLTTRKVTETQQTVSLESLPLGVWLQRGWDKEVVEASENYYDEHLKTQIYTVPVRTVLWREIRTQVEEQVLELEKAAKDSKDKKKKNKNPAEQGEDLADLALDLAPLPTNRGPGKGEGRGKAGQSAAAAARADAKAERERQREVKKADKHNEQQSALAAKAVGLLTGQLKSLQGLHAKGAAGSVEGFDLPAVTQAKDQTEAWKKAATELLTRAAGLQPGSGLLLAALPFSAPDLQAHTKSVAAVAADARAAVKDAKPPPKRKQPEVPEGAEPAAPKRRTRKKACVDR